MMHQAKVEEREFLGRVITKRKKSRSASLCHFRLVLEGAEGEWRFILQMFEF